MTDRVDTPLLAADVGGTKTDLAIFTREQGPRAPLVSGEFLSSAYPSLDVMLREFLDRHRLKVEHASIGIAGPVVGGHVKTTNLPWEIGQDALAAALGFRTVHLLNDLEAIAWAIPSLRPEDVHTLNVGQPVPGGTLAVIAPGTGLGEGFLTWDEQDYRAHASEGGHADFAPTDALQVGLLQYLQARHEHVSFELVCSGLGLPNIYAFLRDSGYAPETPDIAERLDGRSDATPIIIDGALNRTPACRLCAATLDAFVAILGAEAGNLALKVLATGGVYVAGGIPMHLLKALDSGRFLQSFLRKGRLSEMLARIPVHVVIRRVALIGAARYGLAQLTA